jgi:hypothetical protein
MTPFKTEAALALLLSLACCAAVEMDKRIELTSDYSVHELPPSEWEDGRPQPLQVNFSVNLRNVLGVNEKDQLISLETSLRMFWRDTRVKVNEREMAEEKEYITLNPKASMPACCCLHS